MKPVTTALSAGLLAILLAAGAVVAEPPPMPDLSFYKADKLIETRRMTPGEHTAYLKMKLALGTSAGGEINVEELTRASIDVAAESLRHAAHALQDANQHDAEESSYSYSYADIAGSIGEEASELGKFAARMGKSADTFQKEIKRNSSDLDYDRVMILDGENKINLDFEN